MHLQSGNEGCLHTDVCLFAALVRVRAGWGDSCVRVSKRLRWVSATPRFLMSPRGVPLLAKPSGYDLTCRGIPFWGILVRKFAH